MSSVGVNIKGIHKYFYSIHRGKIVALKAVDIEIRQGEFFVILGPSGCGKSTLLNIIAGLENPSAGEIWFDEHLVCSAEKKFYLNPKERNVAMVFQSYALYPHMTVYDNIAFPLSIARAAKNHIDERVRGVAEMLHIKQLLGTKPRELSGGQRQRVAMARAIIRHPNLFLLDEPLSNLDAKLRVKMRSELKALQKNLGVTTVYVTHDQVEAMTLGDRIAVLKDGEVQQVAQPLEIYNNPRNTFVAGFLGTPPMNLVHARVLEKDKMTFLVTGNMELPVPQEMLTMIRTLQDKSFTLGIRPEDIDVSTMKPTGNNVEITFIEHLGNELLLHFQLDNQEILVTVSQDKGFKEGDIVTLDIHLERIHIFDDEGNNIKGQVL